MISIGDKMLTIMIISIWSFCVLIFFYLISYLVELYEKRLKLPVAQKLFQEKLRIEKKLCERKKQIKLKKQTEQNKIIEDYKKSIWKIFKNNQEEYLKGDKRINDILDLKVFSVYPGMSPNTGYNPKIDDNTREIIFNELKTKLIEAGYKIEENDYNTEYKILTVLL